MCDCRSEERPAVQVTVQQAACGPMRFFQDTVTIPLCDCLTFNDVRQRIHTTWAREGDRPIIQWEGLEFQLGARQWGVGEGHGNYDWSDRIDLQIADPGWERLCITGWVVRAPPAEGACSPTCQVPFDQQPWIPVEVTTEPLRQWSIRSVTIRICNCTSFDRAAQLIEGRWQRGGGPPILQYTRLEVATAEGTCAVDDDSALEDWGLPIDVACDSPWLSSVSLHAVIVVLAPEDTEAGSPWMGAA